MDTGQLISLILVGALAGTAVAALMGKRKQSAQSLLVNTVVGILGALVGGVIFDVLDINAESGILAAEVSLGNLLAAMIGAVVVIIVARAINRT